MGMWKTWLGAALVTTLISIHLISIYMGDSGTSYMERHQPLVAFATEIFCSDLGEYQR